MKSISIKARTNFKNKAKSVLFGQKWPENA
jgi:hypothetical protein